MKRKGFTSEIITLAIIATCCYRYTSANEETKNPKFGEGGPKLPLEEIEGYIPPKQFFQDYVLQSKPVKLAKAGMASRAYALWEDDYFLSQEHAQTELITVEVVKKQDPTSDTLYIPFKEFLAMYNSTESYMVSPVPEFLSDDVILPFPLQCEDIVESHLADNVMWFSSGGTTGVVHTDPEDNIICIYRGEKHLVLVDPHKYHADVHMDHPEGAYSGIDVDNVDYEKYPGLKGIEYYHVNLTEGDCLFIPYKWIHQVRSYKRNLAVTVWWNHYKNKEVDLDRCSEQLDPDLTLSKVNFLSFPSLSESMEALKDQFYEFSTHMQVLTYDKFEHLMTMQDDENENKKYRVGLDMMYHTLDQNGDNILLLEEVNNASDKDWLKVQMGMELFENVEEDSEPAEMVETEKKEEL